MTDCNPTILKAELKSLSVINERLNCEIGNLKIELESLRQENSRLREAVTNAERNTYEHSKLITKMHGENNRLREALEHKTILLHGGTRLKLSEAQEALDAAMQIIEAVGTTGIYSRYQKAHEWMKRYYPAWA